MLFKCLVYLLLMACIAILMSHPISQLAAQLGQLDVGGAFPPAAAGDASHFTTNPFQITSTQVPSSNPLRITT